MFEWLLRWWRGLVAAWLAVMWERQRIEVEQCIALFHGSEVQP